MKNYIKFANLCARYAISLGLEMRSPMAIAAGKISIAISKRWIREICIDQLDDQEYSNVKTQLFNILRTASERKGWGNVTLDETLSDYLLEFSNT